MSTSPEEICTLYCIYSICSACVLLIFSIVYIVLWITYKEEEEEVHSQEFAVPETAATSSQVSDQVNPSPSTPGKHSSPRAIATITTASLLSPSPKKSKTVGIDEVSKKTGVPTVPIEMK